MFELNDRIAFVTGGARGIGREIVLTLRVRAPRLPSRFRDVPATQSR